MRELEGVIRANAGELLTDAKVFDVYTGKQVADGCKSMAFNLTFQAGDRTLTDTEIDTVIKNVEDVGKCVVWLGDEQIVTGAHAAIFRHNQDPK